MKKNNNLVELNKFLKNPAYLDLEPHIAMQLAKRLYKNNLNIRKRSFKLAILSNFNLDFIIEPIYFCLFQRGINADIITADYGTMIPELLNPKSKTLKLKPDIILIWPTYRDIQKYDESPDSEVSFWRAIWKISIKRNIKIFHVLFDKPPFININNSFNLRKNNLLSHVNRTNQILENKFSNKVNLISIETLQISIGSKDWYDDRMYNLCKQPFSFKALPQISQFISSSIAGSLGKSKKVLVFDLDNTIWGGEVGDLGKDGIELGKETSEGEAFISFQSYIKKLGTIGVMLAVCSKNQEKIAKNIFLKHSDMVIKLEDITCFVANFEDKASNIEYIKNFLNVDYDAIVFIDDSKVECEWVKSKLPEVTTINLQGDPSSFPNQIDRLGLFIKGSFTDEDENRVNSFKVLKEIEKAKSNSADLQSFLKNLNPILTIEEVYPYAVDRVEQLLLKTNQFKLNNYVLNKVEIKKKQNNIMALRLADKLNDYGIVVILIFEISKKIIKIKNWVMSCRVFARNIENATLEILKKLANKKTCNKIILDYTKLKKNKVAYEVINRIGFKKIKNSSSYSLEIKKIKQNSNIKIKKLDRLI